ncbi:hypothetical protein BDY19DRAFT_906178 [Irpex rosettiformis]|uniref:Uncharacterized protein n=1 Tax=Irpex rosettiformis TaxID=378272 RepID=A0ACB8U4X5_9APHY|nr:hypothetical protein BDY19DRAFT_906178 [Irpex rosettiformis]
MYGEQPGYPTIEDRDYELNGERTYSRSIRLGTYYNDLGRFIDGKDLLQRARGLSSFMLSCVKELKLQIAPKSMFTLAMFAEVLDLFPDLKVMNYDSAARLPDLNEVSHYGTLGDTTTSLSPSSRRPRKSLSTLRLHCDMNALKFDRRRPPKSASSRPEPDYMVCSVPMLFQFLSLFQEIDTLDLVYISLGEDTSSPDPKLIAQLPRIHTLIKEYETGTLGHDATSLICRHLNPTLPISVQDTTPTLNFITQNPRCTYPNITRLSGSFNDLTPNFRISAEQFPALESIELQTRILFRNQFDAIDLQTADPIKAFAHSLCDDPPTSLRHVALTINLGHSFQHFIYKRISLDDVVITRLKLGLDWDVLHSLFDAKKLTWQTRSITFVVGWRVAFFKRLLVPGSSWVEARQEVVVSAEQFSEALRKEIPFLGSSSLSLEVTYVPFPDYDE